MLNSKPTTPRYLSLENWLPNFPSSLFRPVDIASLVFFRIMFGGIMLWEVWRYFDKDLINKYWIKPTFHFTYMGFQWLHPWTEQGMYVHFAILGVLACFIALGFCYRLSAICFFSGFSFIFLTEATRYLNHFYLICLISFLMMFIPAHLTLSVDSRFRKNCRSSTVPAWSLWLLKMQLGIVYFYGGIAKLNMDWLRGEPLRTWLAKDESIPIVGQFLGEEWMVYLLSYGGLLFDLLIVPALLWRRTRAVAFVFAMVFHLTNACIFSIGIFPWFMIAATTLFFEPNWPRKILNKCNPKLLKVDSSDVDAETTLPETKFTHRHRLIVTFVSLYTLIQCLIPLRHFMYPGSVHWTEEGHRFSWHMKLRTKRAFTVFHLTHRKTGETTTIDLTQWLTTRQINKMSGNPDMILDFSHYLADEIRRKGNGEIAINVLAFAALNGRKFQALIDHTVDLAAQPRTMYPSPWIMPLTESLPPTTNTAD